ncbi:MAG TPA: deoxyribodipyrimidine photo-lyase [Petrotogaceae bacterium]|nr:deoxyribodipyrimidine photo-lyase [Petrotogaceae bacterium]HQC40283.1 deoxyribodipyrimidine photo-lyase [Petrotogaceae bacterium]
MVEKERVSLCNDKEVKNGKYVLYWMQASQRAHFNPALEYAVLVANTMNKPLIVLFCIMPEYLTASFRHYQFMIEGLQETAQTIRGYGAAFIIKAGDPCEIIKELSESSSMIVFDFAYLDFMKAVRKKISAQTACRVVQVEGNVVVPVAAASSKEEYSAATLRPKVSAVISKYLNSEEEITELKNKISDPQIESLTEQQAKEYIKKFRTNNRYFDESRFIGGYSHARQKLDDFIKYKLHNYADMKNDPTSEVQSDLSPYLHFGQISPVYIANQITKVLSESAQEYLEELIVRRELARNFVMYNDDYAQYNSVPAWAKKTLAEHLSDPREHCYSQKQLEDAQTHDEYWNSAQNELLLTGKMHNYMRMYWGKKIIEWSETPQKAFETMVYLNDRYEMDGRDPSGYAGICWCFGKHDRPWSPRSIFGNVRYMNDKGLERKFKIQKYVQRIKDLKKGS